MDRFIPDIYQRSIYTINYDNLKLAGIKCLLFDLDNTIAPVSMAAPNKKMKDLMESLKEMGFKIIIVSNSPKSRLEPFKNAFNVDAAFNALKPTKKKYLKIMKSYNFQASDIACIGDQLLTDIWGANRLGFTSILINPISTNDIVFTKFNRLIERTILKKLAKKGLFLKGDYYE